MGILEGNLPGRGEQARSCYRIAETHLDLHGGCAYFRTVPIGKIVMDRLIEEQKDAYRVLAAVVMPNHVHAVLRIGTKAELGEVMKAIKGGSAFYVNHSLRRKGRLWQPDYFDRLIRSSGHLERCIAYLHWNPVKAGLCEDPRSLRQQHGE